MSRYQAIRIDRFHRQNGKCFYCGRDMWDHVFETRAQARERLGEAVRTRKQLRMAKATAEHLNRLADNGAKGGENVVCACAECNSLRGETPWQEWLAARSGVPA